MSNNWAKPSRATKSFGAGAVLSLALLGGGMSLDMAANKAFSNPSQYLQETLHDMQSFRTFVNTPRSGFGGLNVRQALALAVLGFGAGVGVSYRRDNRRNSSGPKATA